MRFLKKIIFSVIAVVVIVTATSGACDMVSHLFSGMAGEKYSGGVEITMLVNRSHRLADDYSVNLVELKNGEKVDERIYPPLQKMFDDMRELGYSPFVRSGFRSASEQKQVMEQKVEEFMAQGYPESEAVNTAEEWVAVPGTSEHQTGLAVDINSEDDNARAMYRWLEDNSWRYGFVQRYPEDRTDTTGISGEPWHYRYVGTKTAEKMMNMDLVLEEYVERYE